MISKNNIYNKISYRSRRQRKLLQFDKELTKYLNMPKNEFVMEFIEINAEYEHKKLIFTVMIITIILSSIMDIWKYFYNLLSIVLNLKMSNAYENAQVAEVLIVTVFIMIFILGIVILYYFTKDLHILYRKRLFLEEVKESRNRSKGTK